MAKNSAAGLLTSVDSMFTTQEERGVLSAVLVRPMPDDGYQMVFGHRRKRAAELAELPTLSCVVRELTDDEAIIIMVDSNLQREKVLPSEKAFAYKMKLDAMKRQGQRTDITSDPLGQKLKGKYSVKVVAEGTPDSKTQVQRYIRLTNLVPELLNMVDENKITLRPAVELSYLSETEQNALKDAIESEDCTPSHAQAIKLRKFAEDGKLNPDVILSIMQEEKPNQVEQFKMPKGRISKFFKPGTPAQKIVHPRQQTVPFPLPPFQRRLSTFLKIGCTSFLAGCEKPSQRTSPLPFTALLYLDALCLYPLNPAALAIASGCAIR